MGKIRALTEETLSDAENVVRNRFSHGAIDVLHMVMRNPLRRRCADAGDISYDGERPVAFQAFVLRRIYLGEKEIFGNNGALTCIVKGAPVEALVDVKVAAKRSRGDSVIKFSNSLNYESYRIYKKIRQMKMGPDSCTRYLWCPIRPLSCLCYFVRRKMLKAAVPNWPPFDTRVAKPYDDMCGEFRIKRALSFEPEVFDVFFQNYVKTNEGLVTSRTAEELRWIFGDRVSNGQSVVLVTYCDQLPVGYIILNGGRSARRWRILDWIALRNDPRYLDALLAGAIRFLRHCTPAMMLETYGFSDWIQPVLKRRLPHVRRIGVNSFVYSYFDKDFSQGCDSVIHTEKSWFFGPYDGDACMCM